VSSRAACTYPLIGECRVKSPIGPGASFGWLCVLLAGSPSTVVLAAFLRFLIMSSFLLRVDAVRLCMYHHCVSVSARFAFLSLSPAPLSSVHRTCLSLRRSPVFHFCCSPIFHTTVRPPRLPNYRFWMCSSVVRSAPASPVWGGAVSPLRRSCSRPSCLQYHRTVGAVGCAGIERLIRSCPDFEVACHREHAGMSVPLCDLRRVRLLLVACMFPSNACALGIAVTAAGCSPGSHS
jgi:hypothetical protein